MMEEQNGRYSLLLYPDTYVSAAMKDVALLSACYLKPLTKTGPLIYQISDF